MLKVKIFFSNLRSTWGNLPVLLIPVILTIPPLLDYIKDHRILIYAIVILFIIGWMQITNYSVDLYQLNKRIDAVTNENDTLRNNMEAMPERVVKSIFEYFSFGYTERITIYRFDENSFVPVGRYALREEFKKNGRLEYPKNEGFIAEAWNNGSFFIDDLPDPTANFQAYLQEVALKSRMSQETLKGLKMQSRSFYCQNLLTLERKPIAVIVIESTKEKLPIETSKIKVILDSAIGQLLSDTIATNLPLGKG